MRACKRLLILTFYILIGGVNILIAQEIYEIERLKNIVLNKIKEDAIAQDSNIVLFSKQIYVDEEKLNNSNKLGLVNHSKFFKKNRFCHMDGFNIRFYILGSNKFNNNCKLEISRSGGFVKTPPDLNSLKLTFYKEIIDSSSDDKVTIYDYPLLLTEEFGLKFSLEQKKTGCAVLFVVASPLKNNLNQ